MRCAVLRWLGAGREFSRVLQGVADWDAALMQRAEPGFAACGGDECCPGWHGAAAAAAPRVPGDAQQRWSHRSPSCGGWAGWSSSPSRSEYSVPCQQLLPGADLLAQQREQRLVRVLLQHDQPVHLRGDPGLEVIRAGVALVEQR